MYNSKRISIIIPCYNEEEGIEAVLRSKPDFIDEVIVVNNGSQDRTAQVAKTLGARVFDEKKRGYGWACQRGLLEASGDILILMDGDNNHSMGDVKNLLGCLEREACDFVTGSRFPLHERDSMPWINRVANQFISWVVRRRFSIHLTDSQSGMNAFKKIWLKEIVSSNPGMGFSQELKIKAWTHPQIKCRQTPINYQKRIGRVKFRVVRDALKNLYDALIFKG